MNGFEQTIIIVAFIALFISMGVFVIKAGPRHEGRWS
jgi:hypothetical protein